MKREDFVGHCKFNQNISNIISNNLLIYTNDIYEEHLYRRCKNYFVDESSNPAFLALEAQSFGAVAILVSRLENEEEVK